MIIFLERKDEIQRDGEPKDVDALTLSDFRIDENHQVLADKIVFVEPTKNGDYYHIRMLKNRQGELSNVDVGEWRITVYLGKMIIGERQI